MAIAGASIALLAAFDTAEERADAHYYRGVELVEQGEDVKAQLEFRNALKLNKDHVQARYAFAQSLRRSDEIRGAVGQLLAVVELDPNFVPARLDLGEIFLLANRPEDAAKHVEAALALAPDNPRARAMQATIDFKNGKIEEAVKTADEVIAQTPENVTARLVRVAWRMQRGELRPALAEVDAGLALAPEDLSLNVVKLGIAEQLGDPKPIGEQLKALVQLFPKTNQFHVSLAQWHLGQNQPEEAKAQYLALVENNPDDPKWGIDLTRLVASVEGPEAAGEQLRALIASDHPHAEYQFALAALEMDQGLSEEAIARLKGVVETAGDSDDGLAARVEIAKLMIRQGDREAGFKEVDYILQKDPRNVAALAIRGARSIEEDRPDLAINDLRAALDADPENARVLSLLATAHERAGNRELAMERLAQAASVSKYAPQETMAYVRALMAQNKEEAAERVIREAMQGKPEDRTFLLTYAQLRLAKEDWREVERIAEILKRKDPNDPAVDRLEAASLVGRKMFGESIDVLASAVADSGGKDVGAMLSLVRTYIASGQVEQAEDYLTKFVAEQPGNPAGLVMLGSLQAARGKLDEAEAAFLQAIEQAPNLGIAYASLAALYQRKGDSVAALEQIRAGIDKSDNDNLRLSLAMRLEASGDIDGAIEAYQQIYSRRSDSAIVANNLASLLADHHGDDPEQLRRAFFIAQRFKDSENPFMQDTYGWLLHLQGKSDQAVEPLKIAAEALKDNTLVQYHLGAVYESVGQKDLALQQLTRVAEMAIDDAFPYRDELAASLERLKTEAAAAPK